jgi:hypothetical protein
MDLHLAASVTTDAGPAYQVSVTVEGLAGGESATLSVSADDTAVALTPDRRCGPFRSGAGSCAVTATPTGFTFLVGTLPDAAVALTFTVAPDGTAVETDPADNTVTVLLTPGGHAPVLGHRVGR